MSRDLSVVLLAIFRSPADAVEQITPRTRQFRHNLEIVTEADTIFIPIEAEIITSEEHRTMFRGNLEAGRHQTVRILSVRPTSTRDMVTKQTNFLNVKKSSQNDYIIE